VSKWYDEETTDAQRLEFLRMHVTKIYERLPEPDPFQETPADRFHREKQAKKMMQDLADDDKRIKVLEDWQEETDARIDRIIAWVNNAIRQLKANQP
jgi:hypothetical protein